MPIFTTDRLAKIPEDPTQGLLYICRFFSEVDHENHQTQVGEDADYIEFYVLLRAYCKARSYTYQFEELPLNTPHITSFVRNAFARIGEDAKKASQQRVAQSFDQYFSGHFSGTLHFELSEGDVSEIQRLTNELRGRIIQTLILEEKHKQRILKRLEAMQMEIHKRQSNLDQVTGTMCEVLAVIKKAGESAEPWTRIVRNILVIAWASQGRVYELPSSAPMSLLALDDNDPKQG